MDLVESDRDGQCQASHIHWVRQGGLTGAFCRFRDTLIHQKTGISIDFVLLWQAPVQQ